MSVSALQNSSGIETSQSVASQNNQMGKADFLKLLIMQMRYQDPLEPVKDTQYIAQLAQFNSLEQMQNLNTSVSSMLRWSQTTQASSLINREVDAIDTNSGSLVSGTVSEVRIRDGEPKLVVGAQEISLKDVIRIH